MLVHLFGVVSWPRIAKFAIKETASGMEEEYDDLVVNTSRSKEFVVFTVPQHGTGYRRELD